LLERRSQESGVEWSLNMSLQEHIHSPVKASCSLTLWHFWGIPGGPWLVKPHVPLQEVELTVLSCGMGTLAHFCLLIPHEASPRSEVSTQLLLGKGTVTHLAASCWQWGGRGRGGVGALISGVVPCGLQGMPIELYRRLIRWQRWVFVN
jgi:hypothetical protein